MDNGYYLPKMKQFIFLLFLLGLVMSIIGPLTSAYAKPPLNKAIKRQKNRNEYTRFETIIDALNIKPGMSILDIGSGPGYASFLFAEKLHGTGEVFATDIRKDFVDHIAAEAKKRGLKNLSANVVKEYGLDAFYTKHSYNLVFLSNVYHCLDDRINYFSELRKYLKPEARLVLILYNQVPFFTLKDVIDIDDLYDSLNKEAGDSPFLKYLSIATKQLLKDKTNVGALASALIDDFNRMLTDPKFYKGFYKDFYFKKDFFTPLERDYANWLLMTLKEEGVLESPANQINAKAMRMIIKLNRLFIIKRFGDFLENDGIGAYIPAGDANRHTSKYVMLRELETAGYKVVEETKMSPYFDAVILTPKTP